MKDIIDIDLINLIKNTIPNDYCKLDCIHIIEGLTKSISTIEEILLYCSIYENNYFFEKLYIEMLKKFDNQEKENLYFIDAYYKTFHNEKSKEYNKIFEKYRKKNKNKIINSKKIKREIHFSRLLIIYIRRNRKMEHDEKIHCILGQRLSLYLDYIKYQILLKVYNEQCDEEIKRYGEWNLKMIKMQDTIRDKEYLI